MIVLRELVLFLSVGWLICQLSTAAILRDNRAQHIFKANDKISSGTFGVKNGTKTDIKDHPHQVGVFLFNAYQYSGSIISKDYVVTAGIFQYMAPYCAVGVGKTKLSEMKEKLPVEKIYSHPEDVIGINYDISLLKLKAPLKFSDTVKPIEIPMTATYKTGSTGVVSGWGNNGAPSTHTDELLQIEQSVLTHDDCQSYFVESLLEETSICAYKAQYVKPSWGDCAAPLVQDNKLIGLYTCDDGTFSYCIDETKCPSIYTDVVKLRRWIVRTTNGE